VDHRHGDVRTVVNLLGEHDPAAVIEQLRPALRRAWGPQTCAPEDRELWTADNPARGQCITTVLVVHDFVGGQLVRGEVQVDGVQVDFHWWNRLPDATEVDLTRGQFGPHEHVVGAEVVERPTGEHRVEIEYALLRSRVLHELAAGPNGV
jgi:hypothetical protein